MKSPHLLRVEDAPERFAPLIEAARALGLRIGWLELGAAPEPIPESLNGAARSGVLRAVAVGKDRTVAVKLLRGATVLKDLLREHFQGCALVLVRGEIDAPSLRIEGDAWIVEPPGAASRKYATEQLAAALRRPDPWDAEVTKRLNELFAEPEIAQEQARSASELDAAGTAWDESS